jgi:DNA-binding beta-propeller fold protein YncE
MKRYRGRSGFTLIQISILLVVASLVLVAILPSSQTNLTANNVTTAKMNTILTALREFEATNGRLPCPADASQPIGSTSYATEAAKPGSSTNCTGGAPAANFVDATNHTAIGMVPLRALGLSNDYGLDGYGRTITYAADTAATSCFASSSLPGNILVANLWTTNNTTVAVVSHGADGHGAWIPLTGSTGTAVRLNAGSTDTDQLVNAHLNSSFVATASSRVTDSGGTSVTFVNKAPTATFDDMVVYQSPLWNINNLPLSTQTTSGPVVAGPANGNYVLGQTLIFTATFPVNITVTGTPQLDLLIGANTRYATYTGGSGTTVLTFSYIVQASDAAPSGVAPTGIVLYSPIDLVNQTATLSSAASSDYCFIYFTPFSLSLVTISAPSGLVIDSSTNCTGSTSCINVVDSNNSRFVKWTVASPAYSSTHGSLGTGTSNFTNPSFITKDVSNNLYIVDTGTSAATNNRVVKWTNPASPTASAYSSTFGTYGVNIGVTTNPAQFNNPMGIGIDTTANCAGSTPCLWIADTGNNRVQRCSTTGTCTVPAATVATYGGLTLSNPTGIAVDPSNNVDVVDTGNNRVVQFNSAGAATTSFNSATNNYFYGSGAGGALNNPTGIAVDSSGNIWVGDTGNNRVVKFNSSGVYQAAYGSVGTALGQFKTPTGIYMDASNNLYVVDDNNSRVQECTAASAYATCTSFGTYGSGNSNFNF